MSGEPPNASAIPSTSEFDVCVIGAGAAGLVITEILSRDPNLRVCLLEAGPDHFRDRREPYRVRSLVREHAGVNEARVTAFGGATNTWGGGLMRLSPADFAALHGRPDTAWPFPFDDLIPHYRAIEKLFGFSPAPEGPESIFINRPGVCVRRREIPILPFRAKNFAYRFGPMLRARANVTIHCNAGIERFNAAPARGLSHLDVRIADGARLAIAAKRYVVSAGTVNTNLLAGRILEACGASDALDEPGRFFHDHLSIPFAVLRPVAPGRFSRRFGYRFERGLMFGEHFDIEGDDGALPGAFLHLAFDMSTSSILGPVRKILNTIQQRAVTKQNRLKMGEIGPLMVGLPRLGLMRYLHHRLYLDPGTRIVAAIDIEQVPHREARLRRDGDGCTVSWDVTPDDVACVARSIPVCREILNKLQSEAAFKVEELAPDPAADSAGFAAYVNRTAVDALHNSGGLRMSAAPGALVDPQLRLTRAGNVHVISSAVFPRVGTSNSTHTILALGHRLAEHIVGTLGDGSSASGAGA